MKKNIPLFKRILLTKWFGFFFWLLWFIMIPYVLWTSDLMLRFAFLFWYTTMWAFIWVMWFVTKHPYFNFHFPYYVRGAIIGGWMNFVLALFMFDRLVVLFQNSVFSWMNPFWIIAEWILIWLILDTIGTKYAGEWKDLIHNGK